MADESKRGDALRVFVHKNEAHAEGVALRAQTSWTFKAFRKNAAKKLKLKQVQRVFLASGVEITDVDDMQDGDMLYCSTGGPFYKSRRAVSTVETLNVAVLGAGHVGKSALTLRFVRDFFVKDWDPTIEDAYRKNLAMGERTVQLEILDTAGQEDFESLRPQWMMDKDAYMFVFALDARESLAELEAFYQLYQQINETKDVPIVLCGTKADLVKADPKVRQVPESEAKAVAARYGAKYIETSACTGDNVEAAFRTVVQSVWGNKPAPKPAPKPWFRCAIL